MNLNNDNREPPEGIGPHEGRELELMLSGQKPMAMFSDVVPASMALPIDDFHPFVKSGQIVQFEETYYPRSSDRLPFRYVYFSIPDEVWRVEEMRKINRNIIERDQCVTDENEKTIGSLLGYTPEQIAEFIAWQHHLKTSRYLVVAKVT